MQLTKDDIEEGSTIDRDLPEVLERQYLNFSKFQQVVEFYEKYRAGKDTDGFILLRDEQPEIYKEYNIERIKHPFRKLHYNNWLFTYCFGDVK